MTTPLSDLDHPSPQQLFDAVVAHAAKMPWKSSSEDSADCLYRSKDGNACFVGCLLTDDEVENPYGSGEPLDRIGDSSFDSLHDEMPVRLQWEDQRQLLSDLQNVHDSQDMEDWPVMLNQVGKSHSLDCECIDLHFIARS